MVFEVIGISDRGARQLAVLAHHDEAAAEREGERRRHQEAARFDAGQDVGLVRADRRGEPIDRRAPRLRVRQQRRDVVEQDAGLGKIRDAADMVLDVHARLAVAPPVRPGATLGDFPGSLKPGGRRLPVPAAGG
jgi:hypothetical protein